MSKKAIGCAMLGSSLAVGIWFAASVRQQFGAGWAVLATIVGFFFTMYLWILSSRLLLGPAEALAKFTSRWRPLNYVEDWELDERALSARLGCDVRCGSFSIFRCPACDHIYLRNEDIVLTDPKDLTQQSKRIEQWACIGCGKVLKQAEATDNPLPDMESRVLHSRLIESDWVWVLDQDPTKSEDEMYY